jgi:hypothetical protein
VSAPVYVPIHQHGKSHEIRMKTARLVLLVTPAFKKALAQEARKKGVSISELVRSRVEAPKPDPSIATLTKGMREHASRIRELELKWDAAAQVAAALKQSAPVGNI